MATPAKSDFATLRPVPTLADLVNDPAKASIVPREVIPQLRGELAQLDTLLLGRFIDGSDRHDASEDQLLDVAEAAGRLGVSEDYLYRNHKRLPFTRRVGRKLLFSAKGLEKHIRSL